MWESRVLRRAFERLELHEGKLSRAVLRGGGGGDVTSLPDPGWATTQVYPAQLSQQQIVAQRESLEHPFTRRIEPPPILDRTEPQPLLQARRRAGSRHAAVPCRLQVVGSALLLNVLDPLLGVEDACREHPPIHPPRGQQLKQLARAQSGATGGVMVTMDRGEEQVHGAPGEKANNVELTAKPWQAVGSFALSPCGNSCGRG